MVDEELDFIFKYQIIYSLFRKFDKHFAHVYIGVLIFTHIISDLILAASMTDRDCHCLGFRMSSVIT